MASLTLDVRHQLCPLPVIRTQNRIRSMAKGDILQVLCTDPGALHDIPAWCRINGHEVVGTVNKGEEIIITVKVCGD
ncbi:MAG: sulfurtransferase TusA family protein [Gammaproteobacteria bacterium]